MVAVVLPDEGGPQEAGPEPCQSCPYCDDREHEHPGHVERDSCGHTHYCHIYNNIIH